MVTKTYYLVPGSQGGPAITPGSNVTRQLSSSSGNCQVNSIRMVAEVLK